MIIFILKNYDIFFVRKLNTNCMVNIIIFSPFCHIYIIFGYYLLISYYSREIVLSTIGHYVMVL